MFHFSVKSSVTDLSVTGVILIQLENTAAVTQVYNSGILASWEHKIPTYMCVPACTVGLDWMKFLLKLISSEINDAVIPLNGNFSGALYFTE